jgi:hypothetical protein
MKSDEPERGPWDRRLEVLPDTLDAYGRSAAVLTPELLRRLAIDHGCSAREIAERTGFSPRTVLTHLTAAGLPARPSGTSRQRGGHGGRPLRVVPPQLRDPPHQ